MIRETMPMLALMGTFIGGLPALLICAHFGINSKAALVALTPTVGMAILVSFYHFVGLLHFIARSVRMLAGRLFV